MNEILISLMLMIQDIVPDLMAVCSFGNICSTKNMSISEISVIELCQINAYCPLHKDTEDWNISFTVFPRECIPCGD